MSKTFCRSIWLKDHISKAVNLMPQNELPGKHIGFVDKYASPGEAKYRCSVEE